MQLFKTEGLNQEELDNLDGSITKKIVSIKKKKNSLNKSPEPDGFTGKFLQTYKELVPIFLKLFQKTEEEKILSKTFCEATITLIPKPNKDTTRKGYKTISLMNIDVKIVKVLVIEFNSTF